LERLTANAKVAIVPSQYPPTQWNLWAADKAVLNEVFEKIFKKSPLNLNLNLLVNIDVP
jgi:hypothetical protein